MNQHELYNHSVQQENFQVPDRKLYKDINRYIFKEKSLTDFGLTIKNNNDQRVREHPKVWSRDRLSTTARKNNTKTSFKHYAGKYTRSFILDELERYNKEHEFPIKYKQHWSSYNLSQTNEFSMFQDILIELLDSLIVVKKQQRNGRPWNDLIDMLFCCIMRAYYGKSSRRSVSFLDPAVSKGYISKKPHFNTVLKYYKDKTLVPVLKHLIEYSAIPLKDVEVDFAIDSSGFSTSLYGRWLDVRAKSNSKKRVFKKAHVTSGVKTNIITAINVTPGYYADSPQFQDLIKITAKNFKLNEVSADKAYSSRKNLQTVVSYGAVPFIPFKKNAVATSRGFRIWSTMKIYYDIHNDHFMMHYHKRSNAESVFNMMKRKFGTHLYSKSEVGQINEILCKALAHNICVLIQEYHENDVKRNFSKCAKARIAR